MLPGFSAELMPKGREKESQAKIKRYMTMMDSMTNEGKFHFLMFSNEFSCITKGNIYMVIYCIDFNFVANVLQSWTLRTQNS